MATVTIQVPDDVIARIETLRGPISIPTVCSTLLMIGWAETLAPTKED